MPSPRNVVFRTDGSFSLGVGHLVRTIALAEEFQRRGYSPVFSSMTGGVPWVEDELARHGFRVISPASNETELVSQCNELGSAICVLDSYRFPEGMGLELRQEGIQVAAFVDNYLLGQSADIFIDQNIGAEGFYESLPEGSQLLAGTSFAALRDRVVDLRPPSPKAHTNQHKPKAVAFFGGTDATGVAPLIARAIAATGVPVDLTIVAATQELHDELAAIPTAPDQTFNIIRPTNSLIELVVDSDVVVSAAGSSLWELACVGACVAAIEVVDNQSISYSLSREARLIYGLGNRADVEGNPDLVAQQLQEILVDPVLRTEISENCWNRVDGLGKKRIVDALLG